MKSTNIAFYGIGNFGYSFLRYFDRCNDGSYHLTAYDYNPDRVAYLTKHRRHPTLHTDTKLQSAIHFTSDTSDLLQDCDIVILAVPSTASLEAIEIIKKHAQKPLTIINTAKALDTKTGERLSMSIAKLLADTKHTYAAISGGTIATDLFANEPLGATIASLDSSSLTTLKALFHSNTLYIETTDDLIGVEYAGAFKNLISILAGIVAGLGMSYGTETHIISRTAQQIADVCVNSLGAKPETFSIGSQCWGNDMWMSCTGNTRNHAFGELVGKGVPPVKALKKLARQGKIVEGINTVRIIQKIPEIYSIPIVKILRDVVVDESKSADAIRDHLLSIY